MHLKFITLAMMAAGLFAVTRAVPVEASSETADSYRFLSNSTSQYLIKSLPEVDFPIPEMYGGNIPIDEDDPSRTLYFIFVPAIEPQYHGVKEVTIFLNGGPGCSSLGGFLQENGPVSWKPGHKSPSSNPYSWANITNMIWVDQPVGAGFSTGHVNNTGEIDIGQQFIGFFKNWEQTFGISNYKIYVTGESYAGRYIPYISAAMLDAADTEYYDVQGAIIYDPVIGSFQYTQEPAVTYPFVVENNDILKLNSSSLAGLQQLDSSCGYAALREKYFTFPPPGNQPPELPVQGKCDVWYTAVNEIDHLNHCFNIYEITQHCPEPYDPLGFTGYNKGQVYFNRTDVKAAIHAPQSVNWALCGERKNGVFDKSDPPGPEDEGDAAPDPIQGVLPQVIDATQRVLVANGDYDMIIITNGTLLAIQNMTWGGKLGFQSRPNTPINVPGQGDMGIQHYERGLMWAETFKSGHEEPEYQPQSTLLHLNWVLGRINTL